jgi:hypothetical protein
MPAQAVIRLKFSLRPTPVDVKQDIIYLGQILARNVTQAALHALDQVLMLVEVVIRLKSSLHPTPVDVERDIMYLGQILAHNATQAA